MRKPAFGVSVLLIALTLGACSMASAYGRPAAPIADGQSGAATQHQGAAINTLDWKSFIIDAELRRLVDVALDNNRSLRRTLPDIEAARAQYRVRRADRVPGLDAAATGNRQRQPADLSAGSHSEMASSYQVGLVLPGYELGLSSRVRNLADAALQQYLASEEAARTAQIALVVEVNQTYLSYDGALRRLALTRQTLVSREYSLVLIDQRRAASTATTLDYQEALDLVEQARAEQERNLRQKQQTFNALVLLLGSGDAARTIPRGPGRRPKLLQDIAPGTPSELIRRRPDILTAGHRLRARDADIGATRAAFFSCTSLTGSFGTSNAEMSSLFDGGLRSWSFLPTLTLPIFDGGRNRASLSLAEARKDSAMATYEGTIQTAFREVTDAPTASDTLRREKKALRALANNSNETLKLAKVHYESGTDDHLCYLDAQRSSFLSEIAFIDSSTQRQIILVNLFRALGGGWDEGRSLAVHRDSGS